MIPFCADCTDSATAQHCRLNWQLHFGESPKWAPGVQFVLVDPEPSARDAGLAAVVLHADAAAAAEQLRAALGSGVRPAIDAWVTDLQMKVRAGRAEVLQLTLSMI